MLSWISKQPRGSTTPEILDFYKMLGLSQVITIDEGTLAQEAFDEGIARTGSGLY